MKSYNHLYEQFISDDNIRLASKPTIYDIRQMLSYLGWIDHTDTYKMYVDRIKPIVSFQDFKRRISYYDRIKKKEEAAL